MFSANRFVPCETQRHTELQPECPVLVYCSKRCVETRSGTVFARVRLVNRTDREIGTVCLQIEGRRADGSTAFSIDVRNGEIVITTRGFGHRVGMSQYGAEAMALEGNHYQQILEHYYSGTILSQWEG